MLAGLNILPSLTQMLFTFAWTNNFFSLTKRSSAFRSHILEIILSGFFKQCCIIFLSNAKFLKG